MSDANSSKTALVTGGTDGIGKEVAVGLARAGHRVIVVGRDTEKGARAVEEISQTTGNSAVHYLQADLGLVCEANRLADELVEGYARLNYLVHGAGVVRGRLQLTAEGVESNFALNYLGRFALTRRLLPLLKAAGTPQESARIVLLGGAARNGTIHFNDVNLSRRFSTIGAVLQFCQANDVFTIELARRLAASKNAPSVTITCLKIGVVKTNIRREFPTWMKIVVPLLFDLLLGQTRQEVATSALSLLLDKDFEGVSGALFLKIKAFKRIEPGRRVLDPAEGRRLWEFSEDVAAHGLKMKKR